MMHDCEPYGHMVIGGVPLLPPQIARLVGLTPKEFKVLLMELESAGVLKRTAEGAIYSARMVRDEDLRKRKAKGGEAGAEHGYKGGLHGIKGGRPRKLEGGLETPLEDDTEPPNKPPPAFAFAFATTKPTTTTVVPVGEVVGCGEEDAVADKPRRPASHGSRLPADWTPTPEDIAYCRAKRPELEPLEVAEAFREFWWAKAGAAARKADWSLTWRTWVRNERTPAPRVNGKHAERQRIASEIAAIARGANDGTVIDITPRAATPALGGPFV